MTFFSFLLLRYFLSIFLSSGLACVLCVVCFFHFLFCLSYPDLVSSCGKPDCKKNKSDAWDRDRLYNPFAFAGVSVVSPLTTFHSKTYPSDSSWAAQLRRGQISVLVSWVVNTFLKETDNRRYGFPVVLWDLRPFASKQGKLHGPSLLDLNPFILEVEVEVGVWSISVSLSHPDHHFTSSPHLGGKKSCCALFITTALHCVVTAVSPFSALREGEEIRKR